ERVPPTRDLARSIGLSRNTVARAYEWLVEAGGLGAHVGRGTFVVGPPRARAPRDREPRPVALVQPAFAWPALFASRARALRVPFPLRMPPEDAIRFDFRPGRVDTHGLPVAELQGAWQRAVGHVREAGNDLDVLGWRPLRAAI